MFQRYIRPRNLFFSFYALLCSVYSWFPCCHIRSCRRSWGLLLYAMQSLVSPDREIAGTGLSNLHSFPRSDACAWKADGKPHEAWRSFHLCEAFQTGSTLHVGLFHDDEISSFFPCMLPPSSCLLLFTGLVVAHSFVFP